VAEKHSSPEKSRYPDSTFRSFWDETGQSMPSFFDASSTRYYFECEKSLFKKYFPHLGGSRIFKTDLWDEAKNTRILKWAAEQGAEVYGLDISFPIARDAGRLFKDIRKKHGLIVSDLRSIAFADESFDYLYSMGTIEHFREYSQALEECYRVLRRGGVAVIGVPNKYDPFLRPAMVSFLNRLGLYAYGHEKSFSMRALERMLRGIGFRILDRTGILFMPGILRMADLFIHVRLPKASFLTAPFVAAFSCLYRNFPSLARHGYLIACVVQKPGD